MTSISLEKIYYNFFKNIYHDFQKEKHKLKIDFEQYILQKEIKTKNDNKKRVLKNNIIKILNNDVFAKNQILKERLNKFMKENDLLLFSFAYIEYIYHQIKKINDH